MNPISLRRLTQTAAVAALSVLTLLPADKAQAQEAILGEIKLFGFNFCPRGYAAAAGQLLPISSNTALFSLYGTYYGGDGRTTFALPDLRGRAPLAYGQGPGLSNYPIGAKGGTETVTLNTQQMPAHTHALNATNAVADQRRPKGDILAWPNVQIDGNDLSIYGNGNADVQMQPDSIGPAGNNQPHENRPPYIALNWCVATQGIFPSRS